MAEAAFPPALTDLRAFHIAQAMLDGFDRHYRLFREASAAAKQRFEAADWHGQQRAQRERIEFYDLRVEEAAERLQREFQAAALPKDVWQQVKLHYIGLLIEHHQPECAETFFNSVTTKILHRSYFHNDFIFVRPAVSTEYIENDEPAAVPTYRAYYPTRETLRETWRRIVDNFQLEREFEDLDRDVRVGARGGRRAARPVPDAHQLPDPGAGLAVLPQQGRLRRRQGHQRLLRDPVRAADPARREGQAGHRHGALRRGRPAAAVQLRARLLHGRDGGAVGLRALPALADAEEAALRDLQRDRAAEAGQEPVLPRLPDAHAPLVRQVPHRARHQGHGDAGVRPAELSRTCSRSSRTSIRRRRRRRAS